MALSAWRIETRKVKADQPSNAQQNFSRQQWGAARALSAAVAADSTLAHPPDGTRYATAPSGVRLPHSLQKAKPAVRLAEPRCRKPPRRLAAVFGTKTVLPSHHLMKVGLFDQTRVRLAFRYNSGFLR